MPRSDALHPASLSAAATASPAKSWRLRSVCRPNTVMAMPATYTALIVDLLGCRQSSRHQPHPFQDRGVAVWQQASQPKQPPCLVTGPDPPRAALHSSDDLLGTVLRRRLQDLGGQRVEARFLLTGR